MYSKYTDYEMLKLFADAGYSSEIIAEYLGCSCKFVVRWFKRYNLIPQDATLKDMRYPNWGQGYRGVMKKFTYEDFVKHRTTENRESFKSLATRLNLNYYNFKYVYYHIYKKHYDGKITL